MPIKIEAIFGEKEFQPPRYALEMLPGGMAKLVGGCVTMTGDANEIIRAMRLCVPESLQIAGIPNGPADAPPASNG